MGINYYSPAISFVWLFTLLAVNVQVTLNA